MRQPSIAGGRLAIGRVALNLALISSLVFGSAGCRRQSPADEQRYELKGKVVSVDDRGKTVTIAHESIPGYMEAMAMPFRLKDEWAFKELAAGDRVQATLVVSGERSWLEGLVFVRESPDPVGALGSALAEPRVGDEVPDFTLVNQDGKRIRLHEYRGRALIVTFIYTRCPLPDYCPLMTQRFVQVREALKDKPSIADKTRLLSISVDPEYDKAGVLREYGRASAGLDSFVEWTFASGSAEEVRKVASYFGMQYWQEGDQIIHALRTAIIGPDGKLVACYRGSDWTAEELVDSLQTLRLD
jgi:protein SCO1/2